MRSGARFAAGVPLLGKNETRLAIGPGVFDEGPGVVTPRSSVGEFDAAAADFSISAGNFSGFTTVGFLSTPHHHAVLRFVPRPVPPSSFQQVSPSPTSTWPSCVERDFYVFFLCMG